MAAAGATRSLAIETHEQQFAALGEVQKTLMRLHSDECFQISLSSAYMRFSMLTPKLQETRLHLTILHLDWYQEIINYYRKPNHETIKTIFKIIKNIYLSQNQYFFYQNKSYKTMSIRKYFKEFIAILNRRKYDIDICIHQVHALQDLLEVMKNINKSLSEPETPTITPASEELRFNSCLKKYLKLASYIEINQFHSTGNQLQEKITELTLRIPHFLFSPIEEPQRVLAIEEKTPSEFPPPKEYPAEVEGKWNAIYQSKLLHLQTTQYYTQFLLRIFSFANAKFLPQIAILFALEKGFFEKAIQYLSKPEQASLNTLSDSFCSQVQATKELLDKLDYVYINVPLMRIAKEIKAIFEAQFRYGNDTHVKILIELFKILADKAANFAELARISILYKVPPNQLNIIDKLKHCKALEAKLMQEYSAISNLRIIEVCVEPFEQLMDALDEKNRHERIISLKKAAERNRVQPLVFSTAISASNVNYSNSCSSSSNLSCK